MTTAKKRRALLGQTPGPERAVHDDTATDARIAVNQRPQEQRRPRAKTKGQREKQRVVDFITSNYPSTTTTTKTL